MTTIATGTGPRPVANSEVMLRQLRTDSGYLLLSLPVAVLGFVVLVVGLVASLGLAVTVVGLPLLAGTMRLARLLADLERNRIAPVLGQPRIRPAYREPEPNAGTWRRILVPIGDPQSWLDLAHGWLRLVVALVTFVVTVVWWAGAIAGTLYWTYSWLLPLDADTGDLSVVLGLGDSFAARTLLYTLCGLFFLITLPLVARGCALTQAALGRALLTGVAEIRNRIIVLEEQKRAAVSAEAIALRRLERDIHDGPQQRLVRLAMDLSRARQQLHTDPDHVGRILDEAVTQTRDTLAELRALSRGIAPPILVDRGLPSALAALAGRSVVPVDLVVDSALGAPAGRLDPATETTAYFVVAEALTNVAKHSRAESCAVSVTRPGNQLEITVSDDGTGGAHLSKGHGLAGLVDRVRANGGTLDLTSPAGGPTRVRAELPC